MDISAHLYVAGGDDERLNRRVGGVQAPASKGGDVNRGDVVSGSVHGRRHGRGERRARCRRQEKEKDQRPPRRRSRHIFPHTLFTNLPMRTWTSFNQYLVVRGNMTPVSTTKY